MIASWIHAVFFERELDRFQKWLDMKTLGQPQFLRRVGQASHVGLGAKDFVVSREHGLEQAHAVLKARIKDGNVSLVGIDKMTVEPDFHGRTIDHELRCVTSPLRRP